MAWLDGRDHLVSVQMYRGKAVGISFPRDGNRHNEEWIIKQDGRVTVNTYADGTLISVEVDLTPEDTDLSTDIS